MMMRGWKATKARNEYLLYMDAANSSIQKYFVDDLSDLIDVSDCLSFLLGEDIYGRKCWFFQS